MLLCQEEAALGWRVAVCWVRFMPASGASCRVIYWAISDLYFRCLESVLCPYIIDF